MDDNEIELLKARIEALERDLRRAISIASEAVEDAQELVANAYQRGFREGFDRAFRTGETPPRRSAPDHPHSDFATDATPSPPSITNDNASNMPGRADDPGEALPPNQSPRES